MRHVFHFLSLLILLLALPAAADNYGARPETVAFINEMVGKHGFDRAHLQSIFERAEKKQSIIDAISRPAEKVKPWSEYRAIFVTDARINHGVLFWRQHSALLQRVANEYGVPPEIIVGILGVETRFGTQAGNYRVIDALSTLAFDYPPRAPFFRGQLEQYLLMTRDGKLDPLALVGSYAGAMGWGQFIPSSYRDFAVDYDKNGVADIWSDPADAIASIANYFVKHGWTKGELVTVVARPMQKRDESIVNGELKPTLTVADLRAKGFEAAAPVRADMPANVWRFDGAEGVEYWIGLRNFFVITQYNHSPMYAMAVHQLGQEIKRRAE